MADPGSAPGSSPGPSPARALHIVLALVFAGALVGLAVGLVPASLGWPQERIVGVADVPASQPGGLMPAYLAMNSRTRGPNAGYHTDLATLNSQIPLITDPVINTEADKAASLALRASRRAYAGAPPTIPHPINANATTNCLACHGNGIKVDGRIAPKLSHPPFTNCTQCHAQSGTPGLGPEFPVENTFAGLESPTTGQRAWPGAPPTMPHSTWMREDCTSCHGLLGRAGMRTTHPYRMNCLQCHATSSALDQRRFESALPPFPAPANAVAP